MLVDLVEPEALAISDSCHQEQGQDLTHQPACRLASPELVVVVAQLTWAGKVGDLAMGIAAAAAAAGQEQLMVPLHSPAGTAGTVTA
jgi:hypothetical protein